MSKFSEQQIDIFLIFHRKLDDISSKLGENLHEISHPIFLEKNKKSISK